MWDWNFVENEGLKVTSLSCKLEEFKTKNCDRKCISLNLTQRSRVYEHTKTFEIKSYNISKIIMRMEVTNKMCAL